MHNLLFHVLSLALVCEELVAVFLPDRKGMYNIAQLTLTSSSSIKGTISQHLDKRTKQE